MPVPYYYRNIMWAVRNECEVQGKDGSWSQKLGPSDLSMEALRGQAVCKAGVRRTIHVLVFSVPVG